MPTNRRPKKITEAERLRRQRQQKAAKEPGTGEGNAQRGDWRSARDAAGRRRFGRGP